MTLQDIISVGLDLLFPPTCVGCASAGHLLCPACAQKVEPVPSTICRRCGQVQHACVDECAKCRANRSHPLRLVGAAALYSFPLRESIHALKYANHPELADPLARYMVVAFAEDRWRRVSAEIDAVVPVPLHKERQDERGYNQSELLAVAFCHAVGLQLAPCWLHRMRATRQQVGLNAPERQQNVDGAFRAETAIRGKTLLLLDDVYTTGATLSACTHAAMDAGAKAVFALTLAVPAGPFDPSHG
jgi:ComF family protein